MSAAQNNSYQYQDLKSGQIRLVDLKPSTTKLAPLHFDLTTVQVIPTGRDLLNFGIEKFVLPDQKHFEALSYTWEGQQPSVTAFIGHCPFLITRNIDDALQRLRLPSEVRTLWIDAICINQSSSADKALQVSIMDQIYASAARVLVWLGQGNQYTPEAFQLLLSMSEDKGRAVTTRQELGLNYIVSHSYWHRIWTMQETILNDKCLVHCGNSAPLPLKDMVFALLDLGTTGRIQNKEYRAPLDNVNLGRRREDAFDKFLLTVREKSATEPLDIIYGQRAFYPMTLVK